MKPRLMFALLLTLFFGHAAVVRAAATNAPSNYQIKVTMKNGKADPNTLLIATQEGQFELDTLQKNPVKINSNDVPVTLKLNGTLNVLGERKGLLRLFLGRTVPYITGSYSNSANGSSATYSQMQVGLQVSVAVTFGQPLLVQEDDSGQVTVLVTREDK